MKAITLKTLDNVQVKLWLLTNPEHQNHIFLTHGTFSNKKICEGISEYLFENGYNCYILEWRNHGCSEKPMQAFNFETIAKYDILAAIKFLTSQINIEKIHAITHSGGGICLTMFLINYPKFQKNFKTITFFSCQAFAINNSFINKIKLFFSKRITQIIGHIPGKKLNLGPENESYHTMKQWFEWNINQNFIGQENDYLLLMPAIKIPIYSISAENDKFISPIFACKHYLEAFKNPQNVYTCFGKSFGNLENYSHARIIKSKNAVKEIYPIVLKWLSKN